MYAAMWPGWKSELTSGKYEEEPQNSWYRFQALFM